MNYDEAKKGIKTYTSNERTREVYDRYLRMYFKQYDEITPEYFKDWLFWVKDEGYSQSAINVCRASIVKSATAKPELKMLLSQVPAPKSLKVRSGREIKINSHDILRVIYDLKGIVEDPQETDYKRLTARVKLIMLGFLQLGLRREELCKMDWSGYKHTTNTITILGKGGKSRAIPLTVQMGEVVYDFWQFDCNSPKRGPVLFYYNSKGEKSRYTGMGIYHTVKSLFGKDVKPHDFRHLFVTKHLNKGVNPDVICQLTGHSSREVMSIYDRDRMGRALRLAADRLEVYIA